MNISSLQSVTSFFSAQANKPTRASGKNLSTGDEIRSFKSTQHQLVSGRNHANGVQAPNKGWRTLPAQPLLKGAPTPKPSETVSRFGGPKPAEHILRPGTTPLPAQLASGIFNSDDPPFSEPTSGVFKSTDPPYASQNINAVIRSSNRAYFASKDLVDISA